MDLREDIDRDLARTPADPFDLGEVLGQGRRAVRRRRIVSAVACAAASVAGVAGLHGLDQTTRTTDRDTPVASQEREDRSGSCETVGAGTWESSCDAQLYFYDDRSVTYTPDGRLIVRAGWTLTEKVEDPIPGVDAVAVSVTNGVDSQWALIKYPEPDGDVFLENVDPKDFPEVTFESWLDYARSKWLGTSTMELVTFNARGQLDGKHGWDIRRQAPVPAMPKGYKGPDGVTTVVQLEQTSDWYLVRPTARGPEAFPLLTPPDGGVEAALSTAARYVPGEQAWVEATP
jgi:hypothetical protein